MKLIFSLRKHGVAKYLPWAALSVVLASVSLLFSACGGSGAPLDANTRQRIDSTSAAQINQARKELDSLCLQQRSTLLPQLIDSIKQKRRGEIQAQMKTVPR